MKTGYLKKESLHRRTFGISIIDRYWRIVDENGADLIQPWPNTKSEARRIAVRHGIELKGELTWNH